MTIDDIKHKKMLIVDDTPLSIIGYTEALRQNEVDVDVAFSLEEAIEKLKGEDEQDPPYHMVMIDLDMGHVPLALKRYNPEKIGTTFCAGQLLGKMISEKFKTKLPYFYISNIKAGYSEQLQKRSNEVKVLDKKDILPRDIAGVIAQQLTQKNTVVTN